MSEGRTRTEALQLLEPLPMSMLIPEAAVVVELDIEVRSQRLRVLWWALKRGIK